MLVTTSAQAFPRGSSGGPWRSGAAQPDGTVDRSGTYQSLHHGSGTFSQSATHTPGSTTDSTTWTNAHGGTGSHTLDNTWNKSTGTGTHTSSTTYADGKTSASQGDWTKAGTGSAAYTGTYTGVNGHTTDVSKSVTDTNGVKTIDDTYTNPTTGKSDHRGQDDQHQCQWFQASRHHEIRAPMASR